MKGCNIFLIGFMGTGKSTIAARMSEKYPMEVVEMDREIVEIAGMSISEIFAKKGETYFRDLETEFVRGLEKKENRIISCGGGTILRKENILSMKKSGKIVLLTASPQEIYERVKNDDERPLLKGRKNVNAISELMEERREKYENAADILIDTDGKSVDEICNEMAEYILN